MYFFLSESTICGVHMKERSSLAQTHTHKTKDNQKDENHFVFMHSIHTWGFSQFISSATKPVVALKKIDKRC